MRNAFWAEWIIACLIGRSEAGVVVGDLLESVGEQETLAFWLSVARIALSLSWRPVGGLMAALLSGYFLQKLSWHACHPMHGMPMEGDVSRLGLAIFVVALAFQWPYIARIVDTRTPNRRAIRRRAVEVLGVLFALGWLIVNYDSLYHVGFLYRGAAFAWFVLMTYPFVVSFRNQRVAPSSYN
jgi:hypothetical protein